jgi:hypothetical protein
MVHDPCRYCSTGYIKSNAIALLRRELVPLRPNLETPGRPAEDWVRIRRLPDAPRKNGSDCGGSAAGEGRLVPAEAETRRLGGNHAKDAKFTKTGREPSGNSRESDWGWMPRARHEGPQR